MRRPASALLLALLAVMVSTPVMAEEPAAIGTYRNWNGYSYSDSGKKVCFMATKPTRTLPAGVTRGDIYAMITHRPDENSTGVVSIVTGYTYKANSDVQLTIGNQRFSLFTDGDTAWARDDATDRALVAAIKAGASMTVVGTSSRGTKTTDTYSLAGSSAAYQAISQQCGLR